MSPTRGPMIGSNVGVLTEFQRLLAFDLSEPSGLEPSRPFVAPRVDAVVARNTLRSTPPANGSASNHHAVTGGSNKVRPSSIDVLHVKKTLDTPRGSAKIDSWMPPNRSRQSRPCHCGGRRSVRGILINMSVSSTSFIRRFATRRSSRPALLGTAPRMMLPSSPSVIAASGTPASPSGTAPASVRALRFRPSLAIDDETLELLAEPLKRPSLAGR